MKFGAKKEHFGRKIGPFAALCVMCLSLERKGQRCYEIMDLTGHLEAIMFLSSPSELKSWIIGDYFKFI